MTTPTPERYFSTDYHTAGDRFFSSVSRAGGSLTALALTTRGPEGDTLTIDYVIESVERERERTVAKIEVKNQHDQLVMVATHIMQLVN